MSGLSPGQYEYVMLLCKNNLVFIGLGSNMGDCRHNLRDAITRLETVLKTQLTVSSVYRSEPVELIDQPWFLNQVACFEPSVDLIPSCLIHRIKEIETLMGRVPGPRYGPRAIDLDIIFFKNWVLESADLIIPHPKLDQRSFVLQPLVEMAPELIHPRLGISIVQLWKSRRDSLAFCEKINE
jgi:2-amino-4-hydroxy-6-hydroxymethyldihydropteridine diphosphokinase